MTIKPNNQVLIVDDDPDYTFLVDVLFTFAGFNTLIQPIHTGDELMAWLAVNRTPSLILLDLKMPTQNGFELLTLLRSDDAFKTVPIVMLTISAHREDVQRCYELGATAYITKPKFFEALLERMQLFSQYWFP